MARESGAAIEAVQAAAADPDLTDADAVIVALGRVDEARRELDRAEAGLISTGRKVGLSWSRVAAALGLRSPQAAEQRSLRLSAAGDGPGGRDVPTRRRRRAHARATEPGTSPTSKPAASTAAPEPTTPDPTTPGAATSAVPTQEPEDVNAALKPSRRAVAERERTPITNPGVLNISARRRVTAADFAADPVYGLARGDDPGVWQVVALNEVIGSACRHGRSRWQPRSPTDAPIDTRTYPSRAEAALQVVIYHQRRHSPTTGRHSRTQSTLR